MKLLFREDKCPDEGFPDYLERLACLNGFSEVRKFKLWLDVIYHEKCQKNYCLDPGNYEMVFNTESKSNIQFYKCRIALEFILRRSFNYSQLNFAAYGTGHALKKICILCWNNNPYRRYYWRDKHYNICHEHGIQLVNVTTFNYSDPKITTDSKNVFPINFLYNCPIKRIILRHYPAIDMRNLEVRVGISMMFDTLLSRAVRLLKDRFQISVNDVYDRVRSQDIGYMPIFERLERITSEIISLAPQHERIIRIVIVICLDESRLSYNSAGEEWKRGAAYSIHPVFYSYIIGVGASLFSKEKPLGENSITLGPIRRYWRAEINLCEFLVESEILTVDEIQHLDRDASILSASCVRSATYEKYSAVTGKNIFDMEVTKRSEL